jgi:ABC-2 type transport system permease protein
MGWLANFVGPTLAGFFSNISPIEHFDDFSKGIIDSKHLVFYLTFMFASVFLTYVTVESARWRGAR